MKMSDSRLGSHTTGVLQESLLRDGEELRSRRKARGIILEGLLSTAYFCRVYSFYTASHCDKICMMFAQRLFLSNYVISSFRKMYVIVLLFSKY